MKTISVVVPVYFNQHSIPILYERLLQVGIELAARALKLELIFIDDGSGDDSLAELLKLKQLDPSIKIIKLTRNFGSIHAIKAGFQHVTGDAFMVLAADLQDPPELILDMTEAWTKGAKFVICERTERDDPPMTKLFAAIFYRIVVFAVDRNYPKGGFDLALMDKCMLPYMRESGKNIYTLLYAYWLGFKPRVIQYKREKRQHGESKWTFSKKLKVFIDILLGFSYAPIRIISSIGVLVSLLSFLYGAIVVINALIGNTTVPGFATITALITFLLGLIIIMLGIIGEYLWRILDETQSRPESVIDEIY
jgi:glycosyltransferase involved in cell wall biosynthesis